MFKMDLNEYIHDKETANVGESQRVDEFFATLGALATLFAVTMVVKSIANPNFLKGLKGDTDWSGKSKDKRDNESGEKKKGFLGQAFDALKGRMKKNNEKTSDKKGDEADKQAEADAGAAASQLAMMDMADEAVSKEKDPEKKAKFSKLLAASRSSTVDDEGNLLPPASWKDRWKGVVGSDVEDAGETVDLELDEDGVYKHKDEINSNLDNWFSKKGDKGLNEEVEKNSSLASTFAPKLKELFSHKDKAEEDIIEIDSLKEEASVKRGWLAKIAGVEDADLKADMEKDMESDIDKVHKKKEGLLAKLLPAHTEDDEKDSGKGDDDGGDKGDGGEGKGREKVNHKIQTGKRGGKFWLTKGGDKVYVESFGGEIKSLSQKLTESLTD